MGGRRNEILELVKSPSIRVEMTTKARIALWLIPTTTETPYNIEFIQSLHFKYILTPLATASTNIGITTIN